MIDLTQNTMFESIKIDMILHLTGHLQLFDLMLGAGHFVPHDFSLKLIDLVVHAMMTISKNITFINEFEESIKVRLHSIELRNILTGIKDMMHHDIRPL